MKRLIAYQSHAKREPQYNEITLMPKYQVRFLAFDYVYFFENILLRIMVAITIIPITINIAIIPESIYFKLSTKAIGLKPTEDGNFFCDMTGFFDGSHCSGH